MIPTRYKAKLSQTLSWPLGAESISLGLHNASHAHELSLCFFDSPDCSASAFQKLLRESLQYEILVATYKPPSRPGYSGANFAVEEGWYDAKWELRIYPVLRPLKSIAGSLLKEHGLPAVARWLHSPGGAGWESHHQRISLTFVPTEGTLALAQTEGA